MTYQQIIKLYLFLFIGLSIHPLTAQRGHVLPPIDDNLIQEFQLSDEQVTALNNLRANITQKREIQEENRRQLKEDALAELNAILSPEQMTALKDHQIQQREARKEAWANVDREALRTEIKAYKTANIRPVKQDFRQQLDESISAEDKATLENLRNTIQERRRAHREERRAKRTDHEKTEEHSSHRKHRSHRNKAQRWEEEHPEEWDLIENLVEKYDEELTRIFEELSSYQQQWKTDIAAIQAKYLPEQFSHRQHRRHDNDDSEDQVTNAGKANFLLMKVNTENELLAKEISQTVVFPNPANSSATLGFNLQKEQVVKIELNDENGRQLKTIAEGSFSAGQNELTIDLSDLPTGVYYAHIRGENSVETVKIIVNK